jgi:uncharacterized protein (DUF952 family)
MTGPGFAEEALGTEGVDQPRKNREHVDLHDVQAYEAMIFHITDTATWKNSQLQGVHTGSTRGVDLASEGYIHCSTAQQWRGVVDRYYADASDLVLLHVDEQLLTSPLIYEQLPGVPEPFPHVYGPINLEAVVTAELVITSC